MLLITTLELKDTMELSDIQKEIRDLIQPHYLVEGIEDEIEIKNTYFKEDEELPSNVRPQPIEHQYGRIWNFAHNINPDVDPISPIYIKPDDEITITHDECKGLINHIEDMYRILKYFEKDGVDFNRYIFIDEGEYLQVYDRFYLKHGPQIIEEAGDNMDVTYLTKRYFKEVERHWRAGELKLETELTDSDRFLAYLQ